MGLTPTKELLVSLSDIKRLLVSITLKEIDPGVKEEEIRVVMLQLLSHLLD